MKKLCDFLCLAVLSLSAGDSLACSCLAKPNQERYAEASDIFIAKVVKTEIETTTEKIGDQEISSDNVRANVTLSKSIKGSDSEQITVLDSVINGANCGVGLLTGREYLFYLYDDNSISICGGTKLYNEFSDGDLIEELLSY